MELTKLPVSDTQVSGHIPAHDARRMSIDEHSLDVMMQTLTNLYSDNNLAVLREYTSNAYDSHVEAGTTDPIQVTTPNFLNPTFVVEDFGIGMSRETILELYSKYGYSTKRHRMDQIGAFGYGAKSALTITDSFTVESNHEGKKTVAFIAKGDDNVGVVNIISHTDTSDRNGVKITIPIQNVSAFNGNVSNFFRGAPKGTYIVDGQEVDTLDDEYYSIGDHLLPKPSVNEFRYSSRTSLVIGGILYEINLRQLENDRKYLMHRVIRAPIGSVDMTPSRDALRYTQRTKDSINELIRQYDDALASNIQSIISAFDSAYDVLRTISHFSKIYPQWNEEITWKGTKLTSGNSSRLKNSEVAHTVYSEYSPSKGRRLPKVVTPHYENLSFKFTAHRGGAGDFASIKPENIYFIDDEYSQSYVTKLNTINGQNAYIAYFATDEELVGYAFLKENFLLSKEEMALRYSQSLAKKKATKSTSTTKRTKLVYFDFHNEIINFDEISDKKVVIVGRYDISSDKKVNPSSSTVFINEETYRKVRSRLVRRKVNVFHYRSWERNRQIKVVNKIDDARFLKICVASSVMHGGYSRIAETISDSVKDISDPELRDIFSEYASVIKHPLYKMDERFQKFKEEVDKKKGQIFQRYPMLNYIRPPDIYNNHAESYAAHVIEYINNTFERGEK